MESTEVPPSEICDEARDIHVQWGMIVGQIIVCIINLASTIVTAIFAHFVFNDKLKHINYRSLLISVTVAVALRAASTLARAMRILAFIAISGEKNCALVTQRFYCTFETEMKVLPLIAAAIGFTFLIFERTFASIFYKNYDAYKNKKFAISLAFLPWILTIASMYSSFIPSHVLNGYVPYCGTLMERDYNAFVLQYWEIPTAGFCIFVCIFVLLFTVRKRKRVIINFAEERLNARIQFDKNLVFAQKVVLITLFAVLFFILNYLIITLSPLFNLSLRNIFLIKELTNVAFGFYGFLFVYINIYKLDSYKKHYLNIFKRLCLSSSFSKFGLCYSTRNSAALTVEGKEYFSYYRQAWQCEKRKTFFGWTY